MRHFKIKEFLCPCCGQGVEEMSKGLLYMLDTARDIAGIPFIITSGFRCHEHNKEVGGSPASSHLEGVAADIKADTSRKRYLIVKALIQAGFNRIGIGKNFVHVDLDLDKTDSLMWTYYKEK